MSALVNKELLANHISEEHDLSKAKTKEILDGLINGIVGYLQSGSDVRIAGLGTFKAVERPAREARNPRTGEKALVPAKRTVKFKAQKGLLG